MKYAVISTGGKQYRVSEGDVIEVDFLNVKAEETYKFPEILLFVDEDKRKIGTPTVDGATVEGIVLEKKKGVKIRVAKFKAKARYRKVIGYRHTLSKIKIEKISLKEKK